MQKIILILLVLISIVPQGGLQSQVSGPTNPDFMKFTPALENTGSVNEFDGSFSFSIPVLSIPSGSNIGYTITLGYQSGTKPTDEASWVGYGWNLNPGSIQRQVKGIPDDFNGKPITIYNKVMPNITSSTYYSLNAELKSINFGVGGNKQFTFNNYSGYNTQWGLNLASLYGGFNFHSNVNGKYSFEYSVSSKNLSELTWLAGSYDSDNLLKKLNYEITNPENIMAFLADRSKRNNWGKGLFPTNTKDAEGKTYEYTGDIAFGIKLFSIDSKIPITKTYTTSEYKAETNYKSYGFLYSNNAVPNAGEINSKEKILMDYYNEKEIGLSHRNDNLSIPFNNADVFTVVGQGISGTFKFHSSKMGYFRPAYSETNNDIVLGSLTLGFHLPKILKLGTDDVVGYWKESLTGWNGGVDNSNHKYTNFWNSIFGKQNSRLEDDILYPKIENENIGTFIPENYYLKFTNDLAADEEFLTGLDNQSTKLKNYFLPYGGKINNDEAFEFDNLNNTYTLNVNNFERVRRTSLIEYRTFGQMNQAVSNNLSNQFNILKNQCFDNKNKKQFLTGSTEADDKDKIAQIKITNTNGQVFVYGIAVTNSNESNKVFMSNQEIHDSKPINKKAYTEDGIVVYDFDQDNSNHYYSGRKVKDAYASSFLLTLTYSPDYIDLTGDGPTLDDIGDYTIFNYRKIQSNELNPPELQYWRFPYQGMYFTKNNLSSLIDDNLSYNEGYKEQYYLESVETKTHVAVFVTNKYENKLYNISNTTKQDHIDKVLKGSGNNRMDNYPPLSNKKDEKYIITENNNPIEYLEKIVLMSKDLREIPSKNINKTYVDKILSVVNFQYDENYPIWSNSPNSKQKGTGNTKRFGKLTLKKIWVDKNDIYDNKISAYQFDYKYPTFVTTNTILNEEPEYSIYDHDAWGYYKSIKETGSYNTVIEKNKYVNSTKSINLERTDYKNNKSDFDPAAWQLKSIIHPSNLETTIIYEENQYSFVQNRPACLLWKIQSTISSNKEFIVNISDNLKNASSGNINDYKKQWLKLKDSLIYFKFYFQMQSHSGDINKHHHFEFVDGYTKINNVELIGTNLKIILDDQIPIDKCKDLILNKRLEMLNTSTSDPFLASDYNPNQFFYDTEDKLSNALSKAYSDVENPSYVVDNLYLRLPLIKEDAKIAGGVRVKQIVNKDNFDDPNNIRFYGKEYLYVDSIRTAITENLNNSNNNFVKYSSGVATNEPDALKSENPLYFYYPIRTETNVDGHYSGIIGYKYSWNPVETEQRQGPYGEGILPAPKVNYGKIIIKNMRIDETKVEIDGLPNLSSNIVAPNEYSSANITVKEFNTVKNFPYDRVYILQDKNYPNALADTVYSTYWDKISKVDEPDQFQYTDLYNVASKTLLTEEIRKYMPIGVQYEENDYSYAQRYQFVINNMHGTPVSVSTYYAPSLTNELTWQLGTATRNSYYEPGEQVKIVKNIEDLTQNNFPNLKYKMIGVDVEYNNESRYLDYEFYKGKFDGDLLLEIVAPTPPYIKYYDHSIKYSLYAENTTRRYFSTNKVINLPSIIKKTVNIVDGNESSTENIAFDYWTGQPVVQKIKDEHTGVTQNVNYNVLLNSYLAYPEMGAKSENQNAKFTLKRNNHGFQNNFDHFIFAHYQDGSKDIYHLELGYWNLAYSQYLSKFNKNDILKIKFNSLNNGSTPETTSQELFKVVNVYNDYLELKALTFSPATPNKPNTFTVPDHLEKYKIATEEIEVIKSGNTNQFGASFAAVQMYRKEDDNSIFENNTIVGPKNPNDSTQNSPCTATRWSLLTELNNKVNDILIYPSLLIQNQNYSGTDIRNAYNATTFYYPVSFPSPIIILNNSDYVPFSSGATTQELKIDYRAVEYNQTLGFNNKNNSSYILRESKNTSNQDELTLYKVARLFLKITNTDNSISYNNSNRVQYFNTCIYKKIANFNCATNSTTDFTSSPTAWELSEPLFKLDLQTQKIYTEAYFPKYSEFSALYNNLTPNYTNFKTDWPELENYEYNNNNFSNWDAFNFFQSKSGIFSIVDFRDNCYSNIISQQQTNANDNTSTTDIIGIAFSKYQNLNEKFSNSSNSNNFPNSNMNILDIPKITVSSSQNIEIKPAYFNYLNVWTTTSSYYYNEKNSNNYNAVKNHNFDLSNTNTIQNKSGSIVNKVQWYNRFEEDQNQNWMPTFKINSMNYNNTATNSSNTIGVKTGLKYDEIFGIYPKFSISKYNSETATFEDFEKTDFYPINSRITPTPTPTWDEYKSRITQDEHHTGKYSFHLLPNLAVSPVSGIFTNTLNSQDTLQVDVWIKFTSSSKMDLKEILENNKVLIKCFMLTIPMDPLVGKLFTNSPSSKTMNKVKQIGDWVLFQTNFIKSEFPNFTNVAFYYENASSGAITNFDVYIDDIRIFPKAASMNCYVQNWDDAYKMDAILDDNHLSMKYVYNSKGELKGTIASTSNGIKTINESYSNTAKIKRPDSHMTSEFSNINEHNQQLIQMNSNQLSSKGLDSSKTFEKLRSSKIDKLKRNINFLGEEKLNLINKNKELLKSNESSKKIDLFKYNSKQVDSLKQKGVKDE